MPQNSPQPPKQPKRRSARFKRSETSRLLKGAADAGLTVRGIEVDAATGDLRVLLGTSDASDTSSSSPALERGDAK
jgi:hypothetical protein